MKPRILMATMKDRGGGASEAAFRLANRMHAMQVPIELRVMKKGRDNDFIKGPQTKMGKISAMLRPPLDRLPSLRRGSDSRLLFSTQLIRGGPFFERGFQSFDLAHFHWMNSGFLAIRDLPKINVPIVWTMHDSWLMTGGCHLPLDCKKFLEHCNKCPQLPNERLTDLAARIFDIKERIYARKNFHVICPSRWLANLAHRSPLLGNKPIHHLPNGLDLEVFRPLDKKLAREAMGLPQDRFLIMFGAASATTNPYKGYQHLHHAFGWLAANTDSRRLMGLILGASQPPPGQETPFESRFYGFLQDEWTMALLYAAADVFVLPSVSENLPNVLVESIACGTPAVAFNVGGISDVIEHGKNGDLISPFDTEAMGRAILDLQTNRQKYEAYVKNGIQKARNEFDIQKVAQRHLDLYQTILSQYVGKN